MRSTLTAESNSMLAKKFARDSPFGLPLKDSEGRVFLDRNPETFSFILDYLRNECRVVYKPTSFHLVEAIKADAEYFGLVGLTKSCQLLLEEDREPSKISRRRFETKIESIYVDDEIFTDEWRPVSLVRKDNSRNMNFVLFEREVK